MCVCVCVCVCVCIRCDTSTKRYCGETLFMTVTGTVTGTVTTIGFGASARSL